MKDEPFRIQIQTDGEDKPSTKQIFENMAGDMEWLLKLNSLIAKMKKSSYDAYIAEGFTETQALILVK